MKLARKFESRKKLKKKNSRENVSQYTLHTNFGVDGCLDARGFHSLGFCICSDNGCSVHDFDLTMNVVCRCELAEGETIIGHASEKILKMS